MTFLPLRSVCARASLALVLALAGCAGAPPTRPDAQLMAGWQITELDLGEATVQLEHPPGWRTAAARKAGAIPAGDIRVLPPPSANGTRINITVFAAPNGFPTAAPALEQKLDEMVLAASAGVTGGKPPSRDGIMRVDAVHGGRYSVVRLDDASVPAAGAAPDQFKYVTIGVLARDGWIMNFTIFHHDAVAPQGEEILGVVRTLRVVNKTPQHGGA